MVMLMILMMMMMMMMVMVMMMVMESPADQTRSGERHFKSGHRTAWEDVLCMAIGLDWRSTRRGHQTLQSWMKGCSAFVNYVCRRWHLPMLPDRPKEVPLVRTRQNLTGVIMPKSHPRLQ
eukprot:8998437-Karenia_brevis.AAC.1